VRKILRRILIPIKPLRRGLSTKKLKMETSRKRNLPLKQASINGARVFLANYKPFPSKISWSIGG